MMILKQKQSQQLPSTTPTKMSTQFDSSPLLSNSRAHSRRAKASRIRTIIDSHINDSTASSLNVNDFKNVSASSRTVHKNGEKRYSRAVERSGFLPQIGERGKTDRGGRHQRRHTEANIQGRDRDEGFNTEDFDTLEYLRDCEAILQNLKSLTGNLTKKSNKIKAMAKIKPIRHTEPNFDTHMNTSKIQKQPSFFVSDHDEPQQVLRASKPMIRRRTVNIRNNTEENGKQSISEISSDLSAASQDYEERKYKRQNMEKGKGKQKIGEIKQAKEIKNRHNEEQTKNNNKKLSNTKVNSKQKQQKKQQYTVSENKVNKQKVYNKNINKTPVQSQEQTTLLKKRQIYMKHLNIANRQGSKLAEIIMQYRKKSKQIAGSSLSECRKQIKN